MDLADYLKPWGEKRRLARALGCDSQLVGQWAAKQRPVPVERCPHIERHSEGAVLCQDLRGDVAWVRVPDAAWLWHPEGRPLLDLTAAQAQQREAA